MLFPSLVELHNSRALLFIPGYKRVSAAQLLLRQSIEREDQQRRDQSKARAQGACALRRVGLFDSDSESAENPSQDASSVLGPRRAAWTDGGRGGFRAGVAGVLGSFTGYGDGYGAVTGSNSSLAMAKRALREIELHASSTLEESKKRLGLLQDPSDYKKFYV